MIAPAEDGVAEGSSASPPAGRGYWVMALLLVLGVVSVLFPKLGAVVASVLSFPFLALSWILPGSTPHDEYASFARIVAYGGSAVGVITALLPVLMIAAHFSGVQSVQGVAKPVLSTLADGNDTACGFLGECAKWLAPILVGVVATIVVQQYVFGVASAAFQELVVYLHAALFLLVAPATLRANGHVRVDIFYGGLSTKRRAIVDLLGAYVLLAPTCIMIVMTAAPYVDAAWRVLEGSREASGIDLVFALKTLIPAFAVFMLIQAAAIVARAALVITGHATDVFDNEPAHG